MSEREEVIGEFAGTMECCRVCLCGNENKAVKDMADEIVRLRSQLAEVTTPQRGGAMSEREEAAMKCAQHIIKIKRTHSDYRDSWFGGESNLATEFMLLRQRVQTAERERDEARRALAVLAPMFDLATKEGEGMMAVGLELMRLNKELIEEREAVASFLAQNRALRKRAERAARVVEAARAAVADCSCGSMDLESVVRALDATPTPGDA